MRFSEVYSSVEVVNNGALLALVWLLLLAASSQLAASEQPAGSQLAASRQPAGSQRAAS